MSTKLKRYCARIKQRAACSHTPPQRGCFVPGKELIRDTLWIKKGKKSKTTQVEVVVFCGMQDPKTSARIEIVDESARSSQRLRVIPLVDLKPGVGVTSVSPFLNSSPSDSHQFHHESSVPLNPESQTKYYSFRLILCNDEVIELLDTSAENLKEWTRKLNLMLTFPHSCFPDEPMANSAMTKFFHAPVNLSDFKADSIWGVYILPEEAGMRTHILGLHFLALLSNMSDNQRGRIDVVNPTDVHSRLISWNREHIRRVGHLGNLSFVELGRRCTGGPGLLWLYAGPEKAAALRRTLHQFLYEGDAHCVCDEDSVEQRAAICGDKSRPGVSLKPTVDLGHRDHHPDGMSFSSQDNLSLHVDGLVDSKHPSPAISWKEENGELDQQRWKLQHWAQSGVQVGGASDSPSLEGC